MDSVRVPSAMLLTPRISIIYNILDECLQLGIDRVLMTCNKTNVASKKSIIKNGGVKENEVVDDFEILKRYWIDLKKLKYMLK